MSAPFVLSTLNTREGDGRSARPAWNAPQATAHGSSLAAKAPSSPRERKLQQAAGQFESMLMSNLWKSMKSSFEDDDSDFSDPAHGAMDEWGMDAMCGAVGKSGGLGIAKLIMKNLEPEIGSATVWKGGAEG